MQKKFITYTGVLCALYSLLLLLSYFISGILFFEWIVSLLPYFLVINAVFIIWLLVFRISIPSIWLLCVVTILMSIRLIDFALIKPEPGNGSKELKILFFNKLYSNANYGEIQKKIKEINPDIIGMAELKEKEIKEIAVLKEYPYMYIKNTRDNASLALFSKYTFSIENTSDFSHLIAAKANISGKQYNIFVFHPISPIYVKNIKSRDSEIKKLSARLNSLKSENIIALGDYNVTPWSPLYINSLSELTYIKNISKGKGMQVTYHKGPFGIPIDYIFVSKKFAVSSFGNEYVLGSDHNLIWVLLML